MLIVHLLLLLTTSKLIPLEYLQAEKVLKMLPSSIPVSMIKVIPWVSNSGAITLELKPKVSSVLVLKQGQEEIMGLPRYYLPPGKYYCPRARWADNCIRRFFIGC